MVFPFLPYPPNDGGRIGFFNPIKYLSRKHEISVVCLTDGTEQESSVEAVRGYCADLRICRRSNRKDLYRILRGTVLWPPGSSSKYWTRAMGEEIRKAVEQRRPDIVEFHHLNTAVYVDFAAGTPTILREHNVEYKVWDRFAADAPKWKDRAYARWSAPRVRKYEAGVCTHFDRCVVVSSADAAHLRAIAPGARIEVIPSGVDTEYFYPLPGVPEEPLSMTLTGSFEWKPKQRSLLTLLKEVFPRVKARVPNAKLYVVGRGVPDNLRRLGQNLAGVTITGPVEDVRPYIARAALLINYLEAGGGIALKVLEAMAMQKPVLCNALGCEGIPMVHGRDVFVADGPENFAEAAAWLLENPAMRSRLGEEGYRRVTESYGWDVIASQFQECYGKLIQGNRRAHQAMQVVA